MTEPRLRTGLWVQAQIRLCDIKFIEAVVARRGDPDAGTVLLRIARGRDDVRLLRRTTTMAGSPAWMVVGGAGSLTDEAAGAYVEREAKRDRDLWVLAIEDQAGRYELDAPLID